MIMNSNFKNNLIITRKAQCFFFTILNAAFSILFIFSFGYGVNISYSLFTLLLLLSIQTKVIYNTLVIACGFFSFLYLPVALTYGPPNLNSLTSMAYTNTSESLEFVLSMGVWRITFSSLILVISIFCAIQRKHINCTIPKKAAVPLFLIATLSIPIREFYKERTFDISDSHYPPARFLFDSYNAYHQVVSDNKFYTKNSALSDSWTPSKKKPKYKNIVIVIGESARKDFMSAYGFQFKNTPFMESSNGILFNNYISSGPATVLSLTRSLYYIDKGNIQYNNSIVRLFKKKGYSTTWISNQGLHGDSDSPVSLAGKQADKYYFLKRGASDISLYSPDNKMLPFIARTIHNNTDKAVFVHIMGSHPIACDRTNGLYNHYYINKELSCYSQSIQNTDYLLSEINSLLSKEKGEWLLVYFSDHGLAFDGSNSENLTLVHSDKYKSDYEVPLFITASDIHGKKTVDFQRTGFDLMKIIAQSTGITDALIDTECNLLANVNCTPEVYVVNKNGNRINFASLPAEPKV